MHTGDSSQRQWLRLSGGVGLTAVTGCLDRAPETVTDSDPTTDTADEERSDNGDLTDHADEPPHDGGEAPIGLQLPDVRLERLTIGHDGVEFGHE